MIVDWVSAIGEIAVGVATVAVAVMVALLTYRSYITQRDTLRLNLFEQRFAIFKSVQVFLSGIEAKADVPIGAGEENAIIPRALADLLDAWQRSRFLFGPEIATHIREIYSAAVRLRSIVEQTKEPDVENRKELIDEKWAKFKWLSDQLPSLHTRFAPYLTFDVGRDN